MRLPAILALALFTLAVPVATPAQSGAAVKKPLTHEVYDSWRSIQGIRLSNNGKWLLYASSPQEGDNFVIVKATDGSKEYTFDRGSNVRFSENSQFVIATIVPKREDTLKATRDKVKAEDRPKNNLLILNLATGERTELERITSYTLPDKDSNWFLYRPEPPKAAPAGQPAQTEAKPEGENQEKADEPKKKRGHGEGSTVVLRNLQTGQEVKLENIGTNTFDEKGTRFYFNRTPKEASGHGVFALDLTTSQTRPIIEGLAQYSRLTLTDDGKKIAILTDKDDYNADRPSYSIYTANTDSGAAKRIAHEGDAGIPEGYYIPANSNIRWSEDGSRLLFGTVKKPSDEKRPTVPDDEKITVDIWSYKDIQLQPQQLLGVNAARNRTYTAIYNVSNNRIVQIETPDVTNVTLPRRGNGDFGLYAKALSSGAGSTPDDVFLVDLKTGKEKLLYPNFMGSLFWSPTGRWLVGFDQRTSESFVVDPVSLKKTVLNTRFRHPIYNTTDDRPIGGGPYGTAGWNKDDSVVYVYDEFDIFALDLTKNDPAVSITDGYGRITNTRYRYIVTESEQEFIDPRKPAYLSAFNPRTKRDGFALTTFGSKAAPKSLIFEDFSFSGLNKARDADVFIYQKEDVDLYRDVYVTNSELKDAVRFSDINPQITEYIWPTAELIEWRSLEGEELQGLIYKPSNFDPAKKYPMIAYFYEKSSDNLHNYQTPAPSASVINIAWFTSNGYIVFVPDIPYKIGYPGESAVSSIVPGCNAVISRGYVDPARVGIQGQSWGGYQVGYLITETNMFAAACAGAPVSNMFSAYGGIRYGSGAARQLQYEQGQSRIGGTMWEYPMRYWENSPIFFVDKIQTPLLIMANDQDGAVPYTQGIEFFTALWRLGKPAWMVNYNGEDHNLIQRKNRKDWSLRLSQFFDHYLKDAPMPKWMSEGVPAVQKGETLGHEMPEQKSGSGTQTVPPSIG